MFGYVKVRQSDLLVREYDFYRAVYCGVCHEMRRRTGFFSMFSLSYDTVFLALVRMLIKKEEPKAKKCRCIAHPFSKRPAIVGSEELRYCAKANALLAYLKLKDNMTDEGFVKKAASAFAVPLFAIGKRRAKMKELYESLYEEIKRLSDTEKQKNPSVDACADIFGVLLAKIFAYGLEGEDAEISYDIGYSLGCVIYALDAFDDMAKDKKKKSYNPYLLMYGDDAFIKAETIKNGILTNMFALEAAVNRLDFENANAIENIIKNTIYLGITDKLEEITKRNLPAEECANA